MSQRTWLRLQVTITAARAVADTATLNSALAEAKSKGFALK